MSKIDKEFEKLLLLCKEILKDLELFDLRPQRKQLKAKRISEIKKIIKQIKKQINYERD